MTLYLALFLIAFLVIFVLSYFLLIQKKTISVLSFEIEELKEQNSNMGLNYAVLQTKYDESLRASDEKLKILLDAKENLSKEFSLLANQIFEDKTKQFSSTANVQLEMLLKPFREQITNFSIQSKEQFNEENKDRHLLKDELNRLKQMNERLSLDATNLANALKGESKTQGNWGEIILERILEDSGLKEGREYELQKHLKNDSGKKYTPDVILHMPQNRDIVIDSKVSLTAYERFVSEEDENHKKMHLKEHIGSISKHIKELSSKEYDRLKGITTLDYVLLFIPIEGAFLAALDNDAEFFKQAYDKNILIVSPSTLMVTLRTIEHIWRTQKQQDNAQKIADEAEAMYDKLVGFVEEMQRIGVFIDKTKDSYDNAMNRLKSGRGNVIKRAENIKALGIKSKKELPLESEQ
ncbi:MAG: DNA recombination protein RmuC [Campylobacterales bacterium]|nr:DNA recombination protein RmuC [Campylobacterales bacterium]